MKCVPGEGQLAIKYILAHKHVSKRAATAT